MRTLAGLLALAISMTAACSAEQAADDYGVDAGGEELPFQYIEPGLDQVAPNAMALGDTIQVFGENFLPAEYGKTYLHLSGSYTDQDGNSHAVNVEYPLEVKNPSVASFVFENIRSYIPSGDKIGSFSGEASITTELDEAYRYDDIAHSLSSGATPLRLDVKPSMEIVQLRSVTAEGCQPITKTTIGGQEIALTLRTIGMEEATPSAPTTFNIGFNAPTMTIAYLKDDGYAVWPVPELQPAFSANAKEGQNSFQMKITEGNTLSIDPSYRRDIVTVNPPVTMGQETYSQVLLGRFSTGPTEGQSTVSTLLIEASRPDGTKLARTINLNVKEEWEIQQYNQNVRLMERSDAIPVSGCFSGGDIGRDLTYTEGSSQSVSRSLSFRWDRNIANTLGVNAGVGGLLPVQISVNASTTFSETFGVDVNETISSETHVGVNFSARIIPGYFGTCYRQLDRLEREVDVVYTNACGVSGIIGQTILTDWNFGFDIATGPSCDTPSDLDEGASYEPDGIPYE